MDPIAARKPRPPWFSELICANGHYYALSGAKVYSSTDAVFWSNSVLPGSVSALTLTTGEGFLYVTEQEYVNSAWIQKDFISLDGVTWSPVATTRTFAPQAALYVPGRILTFGGSGAIQRSGLYTQPTGYAPWTEDHFPAGGSLSGALDDPDGDLIPNLMEYALGTHPSDSGSKITPTFATQADKLTFSVPRSARHSDIIYRIEHSGDLVNWSATGVAIFGRPYWPKKIHFRVMAHAR